MKVLNVCEHAQNRARMRMFGGRSLSNEKINEYCATAEARGLDSNTIKNRRLRQYLTRIAKKYNYMSEYRIFGGYIFIISKESRTVITIYSVPEYAVYEKNYGVLR